MLPLWFPLCFGLYICGGKYDFEEGLGLSARKERARKDDVGKFVRCVAAPEAFEFGAVLWKSGRSEVLRARVCRFAFPRFGRRNAGAAVVKGSVENVRARFHGLAQFPLTQSRIHTLL